MWIISTLFSIIVFVALGGTFLISYFKSKGIYDEYIESLEKEEYKLKQLIPIGLFLNDKHLLQRYLPKKLNSKLYKYNLSIKTKIGEIKGQRYIDYYYEIHMANKIATSLAISTIAALLGIIMSVQGDVSNGGLFSGVAFLAMLALPFLLDNDLNKQSEARRMQIQLEFPEFINTLTLLVNAGMTISKAWEKIIIDNKKQNPLYEEMAYAYAEIKAGKPETVAYEEFGRRCKIKEVIKFVSVIILNLKKGGSEVIPVLKAQGTECWEMRKAVAKRLGEEASTKILFPLMMMLVGILVIVATPAVLMIMGG